jgi:hypothetical protein
MSSSAQPSKDQAISSERIPPALDATGGHEQDSSHAHAASSAAGADAPATREGKALDPATGKPGVMHGGKEGGLTGSTEEEAREADVEGKKGGGARADPVKVARDD